MHVATAVEESDAERFIRESNLSVIEECVGRDPDDMIAASIRRKQNSLATGLGNINFFDLCLDVRI